MAQGVVSTRTIDDGRHVHLCRRSVFLIIRTTKRDSIVELSIADIISLGTCGISRKECKQHSGWIPVCFVLILRYRNQRCC